MTIPDSQVTTGELFNLIGNDLRIDILKLLYSEPYSFSNILNQLSLESTSKLSFHLNKMEKLIQKREDGRYELTQLGIKTCAEIYKFEDGQISYSHHSRKQKSHLTPQMSPLSFFLGITMLGLVAQVFLLLLDFFYVESSLPIFLPIFGLPFIYYVGKLSQIPFELTRMISIQFYLIAIYLISWKVDAYFFLIYLVGFLLIDTIIKYFPIKDGWNSNKTLEINEFIGPKWLLKVDNIGVLIIGILIYEIMYFFANSYTVGFGPIFTGGVGFIMPSGFNYLFWFIFALGLAILIFLMYVKINVSNTSKTIVSSLLLIAFPGWILLMNIDRMFLANPEFIISPGGGILIQFPFNVFGEFRETFLAYLSFTTAELVVTGIILFIAAFELKLFSILRSYTKMTLAINNSTTETPNPDVNKQIAVQ